MKRRALTGVKPTNYVHLGNILGAIEPAIALQNDYETYYFIADYHALTQVQNKDALDRYTYEVAATFLALGLDPERATFFRQSDVPETMELSWILSCVVSIGDLFRAHAYKAAEDKGEAGTLNLGTFSYPVLMAADIILYDTDIVPVGKDQIQHLEMARAAARRFNHIFGETLKEPQELVRDEVATVPGIDGQKMSKSYNNGILPLAPHRDLKKQVMAIVTDSKGLDDVKEPESCHIFRLYSLLADEHQKKEMAEQYRKGGFGYGHAKLALLEKIEARYGEARKSYEQLLANRRQLDEILAAGAARARRSAQDVLARTRDVIGISRKHF